jgi:hypothetical protein
MTLFTVEYTPQFFTGNQVSGSRLAPYLKGHSTKK